MARFFENPDKAIAARRVQNVADGITYYVMHPLLKELVDWRLSVSDAGVGAPTTIRAWLSTLPETATIDTTPGSIRGLLEALGAPPQEHAAPRADQIVTALHFLHKRMTISTDTEDILADRVCRLVADQPQPFATRLRILNECLFVAERRPRARVLTGEALQASLRETVPEVLERVSAANRGPGE
jgi:hypothetical protein